MSKKYDNKDNKINNAELMFRRSLPLDVKVEKTKLRIREWHEFCGGAIYVSFSGGKDSTVILDIVRSIYPDVEAVFCDTRIEFPEIRKFVKKFENVIIIRPKMNFRTVIEKYGYPVISKRVCQYVRECYPTGKNEATRRLRLTGIKRDGTESKMSKLADKWHFLLDAPFKVSEQCCDWLKKKPFIEFAKDTGKFPITGMIASESRTRETVYMQMGCNWYHAKRPSSHPISFWTEQDILRYIVENGLEIASVYGDIVEEIGTLRLTGQQRTGCIFCGFGAHLRSPNQYQLLYDSHPKLWDFCINTLGYGEVLDYVGIPYKPEIKLFKS